jgi:bis(5'-nucleosyl)-tetraphosphatase (symmetrical)
VTVAVYAIGDVQGCGSCLKTLLNQLPDVDKAQLWFAGDLVNRGPESLATLRLVRDLGSRARCVLGNHDLHLLAVAAGIRPASKGDTFEAILGAPDREELIDWLRHQPLAVHAQDHLMVHAGVHPEWSLEQTLASANEVETALRSDAWTEFLADMYGNRPAQWNEDELSGTPRLRITVNILTRMRMVDPQGGLDMKFKGSPEQAPASLIPWFDHPARQDLAVRVVFGHWSTLGLRVNNQIISLDTGCVWGGELSAVRLADDALFQVSCPAPTS